MTGLPGTGDPVRLELLAGGVAHIELNRPDVSNSFDVPTAEAFSVIVDRITVDPDVSAVLLTGAGKRFCAGGDVSAFVTSNDPASYLRELVGVLDGALQRLAMLQVPVVAGVQGAVAGAGLGVLLSCDVIVAAAGTKFVAAYSSIGLTPDCGVTYLLPRAVGQVRALDLLLTGRALSAAEALDWGLVTRVVDDAEVDVTARELASRLAGGPTRAFVETRRLVRSTWDATRAAAGEEEAEAIAAAVADPDAQRLITAFTTR